MASGELLATFQATAMEPPATNYAQIAIRNNHPVVAFDAATQEGVAFSGIMPPNYAGGNLNVKIYWTGQTATTGNTKWGATFEDLAAQDQDADGYATEQTATTAAPGTSGVMAVTTITCAAGSAGTDSLAAGDLFRLRLQRIAADAADTMANDAQVQLVAVYEA